jgi:release factor glutamine methyltransferase
MMTVAHELLRDGAAALADAGIASARLDAEVLLARALGRERGDLLLDAARPVPAEASATFAQSLRRRLKREPVARITGVQEFWSLPFRIGPSTLVPRSDSETLIEETLARIAPGERANAFRVLDLGTGSGCLLLALLSELPNATGVGADVSAGALTLAEMNAHSLTLAGRASFARFDWTRPLAQDFGRFDIILCNPPYVPRTELSTLAPEVAKFEPATALDGGEDGLDSFRAILPLLRNLAAPGGALAVFEVGQNQAGRVTAMVWQADGRAIRTRRDLGGTERVVSAQIDARR